MGPVAHIAFLLLAVLNLIIGFHAIGTLMAVGDHDPARHHRPLPDESSQPLLLFISVGPAMFSSLCRFAHLPFRLADQPGDHSDAW